MASEPMTLAEFEREIDRRLALYDGGGESVDLPGRLRPLILRLLAGERERCERVVEDSLRPKNQRGDWTQYAHDSNRHADRVIADLRSMGDPTP